MRFWQLQLFFFLAVFFGSNLDTIAQCNLLTGNRNITYLVDGQCAPTTVIQFTIEYEFISAQAPADISIRFEWNDPGTNIDTYSLGDAGYVVSGGNTRFQATGTFSYPVNNECAFLPTAYLTFQGVDCASSIEEKVAISWDSDDSFGGVLAITPAVYEVCFAEDIVGAQFSDISTFNCNIGVEPDNPNQIERHVQFVYGDVTTHNPAATILDLSLDDGGSQALTNAVGAIAFPIGPRGTPGLQLTAAYFGPVQNIPFPANAPLANTTTFLMNAPANILNAVGNTFEVTMYNWNICNPYNLDPANPNYDEAISITANIEIVDAPVPGFQTREVDATGIITSDFCIGDVVYFENLTTGGGLDYSWEYFDGPLDTDPLQGSSVLTNPTNVFTSGGPKLIRLTATNPTAQSACMFSSDAIINIAPTLMADIRITDLANTDITAHFCQDAAISQIFDVRFYDVATGTPTVDTGRRWEFFDENGVLASSEPVGVGYTTGVGLVNPPDQVYSLPGNYEVKFLTRDNLTGCETEQSSFVRIFNEPVANFTTTEVCDGIDTHFESTSTLMAINGESIVNYEWDFSYDGVTFTKDPLFDGLTVFDHNLGVANTYTVAHRVVTDQNSCENVSIQTVEVRPLPLSSFTTSVTTGCSVLSVEFTNTAHALQTHVIDQYIWQIDPEQDGSFTNALVQDPSNPGFNSIVTLDFDNTTLLDRLVDVRLLTVNVFNCETISPSQSLTIFPAPQSGFTDLNYDPFSNNCGNVSVDFEVDAITQALPGLTQYTWEVRDELGVLVTPVIVKNPPDGTFNYVFVNNSTTEVEDFDITLLTDFVGGCPSDSTRTIRVNPVPSTEFDIDTISLSCDEMILQFSAVQKGLMNYQWEIFIDGISSFSSSAVGDVFDHVFTRPGPGLPVLAVEIELLTTNFANCLSSLEQQSIDVLSRDDIDAGFSPTPLIQDEPNMTVTLNNSTNAGTWIYLWDFGDGQTSTDPNETTHVYSAFGDYLITQTVSSQYCTEVNSQMISINPAEPILDFGFLADGGCLPAVVQFSNLSTFTDPSSYSWDFGDGSTSIGVINPTHVYTTAGIYSVTLMADNGQGDDAVITQNDIIIVYDPSAAFTGNEAFLDGCGSMSLDFESDVSVQNSPGLKQYTWRVYDNAGNNLETRTNLPNNPLFSFNFINPSNTSVMDFSVELTTNFEGNCSTDSTRIIRVNPIPSSTFDIDTLLIDCDQMVLQMNANQFGLKTYQWEILIGGASVYSSSSDGASLERIFARPIVGDAPLIVDIRLITTNDFNCQSNLYEQNVDIPFKEGINIGFDPTPLEQNQPNMTVILNNTTSTGPWTYLWDFGDGQTSTDPNEINHTYVNYGEYIISLTVNSAYCQEETVQSIKINPTVPVLDFDFLPDNGCAPLRVDFTNLSQFADPSSYIWDFGDGETLTGVANPIHYYTVPGLYNVKLTADNGAGDEASTIKEGIIEVFASPSAIFSVRPEIVILPGEILTNNNSFGAISYLWEFGDGNTSSDFEPVYEYSDVNTDDEGNPHGYDITLIAISENGCRDTTVVNNAVIAQRASEVLVPNAFSPNLTGPSSNGSISDDDFTNDIFLPKMNLPRIKTFRMLIYNKWGELLFESNNKNQGWDGYYKGKLVQQDVYVYRLSLSYDDGQHETVLGDVTLIR